MACGRGSGARASMRHLQSRIENDLGAEPNRGPGDAPLLVPHPELVEGRTTSIQRPHRDGAAAISGMSVTSALTDCDMKQRASTCSMASRAASSWVPLAT